LRPFRVAIVEEAVTTWLDQETVIRLGCFAGVLVLTALAEVLSPRRRAKLARSRADHDARAPRDQRL